MSDFNEVDAAWSRYRQLQPRFDRAANAVGDRVKAIAADSAIKCAVHGRSKTPAEFLKKCLRKGRDDPEYLTMPWQKMTDKAGARAVVTLLDDVDNLARAIDETGQLPILGKTDSRRADPRQLTYRGLHLQVAAPAEPDDEEVIECELQIRTEAQDLWSPISHRFLYKPVVDLPFETERSLHRLGSLIEMFDEEVQRAVRTAREHPEYAASELLDVAERIFLSLVPYPEYDRGLSLQVLDAIAPAVTLSDFEGYALRLTEFITMNRDALLHVLGEYGPDSGASMRYALLSQPEGLIVIERLENAPLGLAEAWRAADMPESLLQATAGVWGKSL